MDNLCCACLHNFPAPLQGARNLFPESQRDMLTDVLLIIFAGLLVLLNGFFVAAEFGLVKLRATRVRAMAKTYG
jgi:hypothetical protein